MRISGQVRSYAQPAAAPDAALDPGFAASAANVSPAVWKQRTRRSGIIAVKVGMTQEWDEWGVRLPLTVLWVDNCQVRVLPASTLARYILWWRPELNYSEFRI